MDGKISRIDHEDGSGLKELEFVYDAMGQRIAKKVFTDTHQWESTTYYIRDAQGNVMSTYEHTVAEGTASLKLSEQHLYGSSRIGMRTPELERIGAQAPDDLGKFSIVRGLKRYELTNHLGNVLSVITDTKQAVYDNPPTVLSYYLSTVISYTDYYPFGAPRDHGNSPNDRSWSGGYRYGFNGKEVDSEGMGGGSSTYDYGFRIYNAQLGKFLSVDPLTKEYPWYTPYQFAGNKPIWAIDLDGLEEYYVTDFYDGSGNLYKTEIQLISSFGMNTNGLPDKQIVHRSRVDISPDLTSYTKTFVGSTEGSATGDNAFGSTIERQFATGVRSDGSPFNIWDAQSLTVSVLTTRSDGTSFTRAVTAATYALVPVPYSNIKASFKEFYYDAFGSAIGTQIGEVGRDIAPKPYLTLNATVEPLRYNGVDPGVNIPDNINAVPPDPYLRGGTDPIGSYNSKAAGGSGSTVPITD